MSDVGRPAHDAHSHAGRAWVLRKRRRCAPTMVECCPTFLYATTPMTAVAQVVNSLDLGGAERVAVSLANGLATADCRAHLLVTRRTGALQGELSPEVEFFNAERRTRLDWAALRKLGRYIDENEIQLLHAHDSATSVVLRLALLFARRRPMQIVHDHAGQKIEDSRAALFDRVFLRHLEGYIAVSDGLRSRAEKLLPLPAKRCIWIPNGIAISPPRQPFDGPPTVIQVADLREPKATASPCRARRWFGSRSPSCGGCASGAVWRPLSTFAWCELRSTNSGWRDAWTWRANDTTCAPFCARHKWAYSAPTSRGSRLPSSNTCRSPCPSSPRVSDRFRPSQRHRAAARSSRWATPPRWRGRSSVCFEAKRCSGRWEPLDGGTSPRSSASR